MQSSQATVVRIVSIRLYLFELWSGREMEHADAASGLMVLEDRLIGYFEYVLRSGWAVLESWPWVRKVFFRRQASRM
jgi:hypothetical protein